MRYKQDLAEFISLVAGAKVIKERAGILEHEAREDIVAALRDEDLEVRWWRVIRGERRRCYADDLHSGFLDNLTTDNINWETSIARRVSVYFRFEFEIEVSRSSLDRLWPEANAAPRISEPKRPDDSGSALPKKIETQARDREIYDLYTVTRKENLRKKDSEVYDLMRAKKPQLFVDRRTVKHEKGISDERVERILREQQRQ
jgi:hypothetical protein